MADMTVARRYAQAMIEIADEAQLIDTIGDDLAGFSSIMLANGNQLGHALYSPVFTATERTHVLDAVLGKVQVHPLSRNLLRLLNDKGRFNILREIVVAYRELANERAGRQQVKVTTAEPLTPQIEAEVRAALEASTGKAIILNTDVDPSLLGGMVARLGGKVIDSSLRNRLQSLKHALLTNQGTASA